MTATDELRRMLDERGVEWWEDAFSSEHRTVFDGKNDVRYCVYQLGFELFISSILPVTPEQAVEATLGRGTCRRVLYKPTGVLVCSECGAGIPKQLDKYCYLHYCPNCGARVLEPHSDLLGQEER